MDSKTSTDFRTPSPEAICQVGFGQGSEIETQVYRAQRVGVQKDVWRGAAREVYTPTHDHHAPKIAEVFRSASR